MQLYIAGYFQGKNFHKLAYSNFSKLFTQPVVVISVLANNSQVKFLLDSWKFFPSNNLLYSIHHPVKACVLNELFFTVILILVFYSQRQFCCSSQGGRHNSESHRWLQESSGSHWRNLCNSGIRNQTSTIVSVGSVKYYHVIYKSKNQEGISGIESRNQAKILYDSK